MTPLYSSEEFDKCKGRGKLPLQCEFCNGVFFLGKNFIKARLKGNNYTGNKNRAAYCSRLCQYKSRTTIKSVTCQQCGNQIQRLANEIASSKSGYSFCNHSCSAKYTNSHKTHGYRKSKLERWLAQELSDLYPALEIKYNDISVIGKELDIFIPALNMAFEINGIFHYKPIYGIEKLDKIKAHEQKKIDACIAATISLHFIDVSSQTHFTEISSVQFLTKIVELMNYDGSS